LSSGFSRRCESRKHALASLPILYCAAGHYAPTRIRTLWKAAMMIRPPAAAFAQQEPEAARPAAQTGVDPAREAELRAAAVAFEASFLAEMLKFAGAGRSTPGFDGGAGEAAFAQELVREQAKLMAEAGGIGLAQRLFESMLQREG
jgi:Rod binding domain-containing protein